MKAKRILYVDDEINNLETFKSLFGDDYDIHIATSAEEGLRILNKVEFQLIISDQRMPHVTGTEFFASIINSFSEPIRILLTGYTDYQTTIDAINKCKIYLHISKPWGQFEMRVAIENAMACYYDRKLLKDELKKSENELASHKSKEFVKSKTNKIFISHSSEDQKLVDEFVDKILVLGLELIRGEDFFCTSVHGSKVKSGLDFKKEVYSNLQEAKAIIQILTPNYKGSEICLNEMGAAWVLSDTVIPILGPNMNFDVGFIHSNTQQLRIDNSEDLIQLYEDHKETLFKKNIIINNLNTQIAKFIKSIGTITKDFPQSLGSGQVTGML